MNKVRNLILFAIAIATMAFAPRVCAQIAPAPDNSAKSPAQETAPKPPAQDTTPKVAPDTIPKAREVVNQIVSGQFDKIEARYDDKMKAALPPGKLAESWKQLLGQTGGFKNITSDSAQTIQTFQVATIVCEFERTTLDAVVSFDADGALAGIRFRPHRDTTPWVAPAYAKPEAFHEDPITVKFGHWELPGTITTPLGDGPFPLVVLVQGSGPHDQDESIGPNKPFKDLAWGLASRGVAVLRYTKRTARYGLKSVDEGASFTVDDEIVNDARAAVELAAKQPKIDPKRIYVLGHSEGGYIAPRIATDDAQIAGIILLAGSARPLETVIVDQIHYLASFPGVPPDQAQKQIAAIEAMIKEIQNPDLKKTDKVTFLGAEIPASYFIDLRGYDPVAMAAKLKIRILVLQGARDYQVTNEDFDLWKKGLANHTDVTFKLYPDLNHLFVTGEGKSKPAEYDKAGHVSPETVTDIAEWIKK
jgi:dienelactone hydrolase